MRLSPYLLLLLALLAPALHAQEPPLRMLYDLRAPLMSLQEGKLEGSVGSRARAALELSQIAYSLEESPVLRQDAEVRNARQPVCAIGRLFSPERKMHGVFSRPIARGPRYVAIIRADHPPPGPASLVAWTNQPDLRWVVQRGFYYSEMIHRRMQSGQAQLVQLTRNQSNLAQLLVSGRADFTLLQEDEAHILIDAPAAEGQLRSLALSDLVEGENRYFYCSHNTPASVLERLDAALEKLR